MTLEAKIKLRLQFLVRVVRKECQHLASTDQRLFANVFTLTQVQQLEADPDLAERVEAFIGRFGRLQDRVGDKLLPLLLAALDEKKPVLQSTTLTAPSALDSSTQRTNGSACATSETRWFTNTLKTPPCSPAHCCPVMRLCRRSLPQPIK